MSASSVDGMTDLTVHVTSRNGTVLLSGYACGFEECERYGGPAAGGWIERIDRNAFVQAVAAEPDMVLLWNFEGSGMACTRGGTLRLSVDDIGLRVEATVPDHNPTVAKLVKWLVRSPDDEDIVQWGCSFRVQKQEWSPAPGHDDDTTHRVITALSLHKGAISMIPIEAPGG